MPGGIWGLISPKLILWAEPDMIQVYRSRDEFAQVDCRAGYGRGRITNPQGLSQALVATYREHSHRSYGVAPAITAYVPPGISPSELLIWDVVLRTSGASDWMICDSGLACFNALTVSSSPEMTVNALLLITKNYCAWQVIRGPGKSAVVSACDSVPYGAGDEFSPDILASLLNISMIPVLSRAVKHMVEDEVAMVAASPVLVLHDAVAGEKHGHCEALLKTFRKVLGGGGEARVAALPSPGNIIF